MSASVHQHVAGKVVFSFEPLGELTLKNIAQPVHAYALEWKLEAPASISELRSGALPLPDRPSIAVLPFTNMSPDAEQEVFADGLAEDIITALSKLSGLLVIARNSSFAYKGRSVDLRQVAKELAVRYVLEGSVRRSANRVRVTVQLNDAESGASYLGRGLRPRTCRHLRRAGRDRRAHRRGDRAWNDALGDAEGPSHDPRALDRLGPDLPGDVALQPVHARASFAGPGAVPPGDQDRSVAAGGPHLAYPMH